MPLGIAAEMSEEDQAALEALRDPNEQPLEGDEGPGGEVNPTAITEVASSTAEGKAAPAKSSETTTTEEVPQKGDPLRGALRAARAAERRALNAVERERADKELLIAENEALKAKVGSVEDESTSRIERIRENFPELADELAEIKSSVKTAEKPQAKETAETKEFEPLQLPPELQDVVDTLPDLLEWQNDPDQNKFEAAIAAEALLLKIPAWKNKPLAERLSEVVRRVNADMAAATTTDTSQKRIDAQTAIDNAPTRMPRSVGEIGGGGGREPQTPDVARFSKMSSDDVEAELMTRG